MAGPSPARADARVGPYVLQRELGRGGAAVVWLAAPAPGAEPSPHRPAGPVALKLSNTAEPEQLNRFSREFDLLRTIRLPGVVRVHETGTHEGGRWYTMDPIEGRRFTHVVREAADTAARCRLAVRLGARLAGTMAALHGEGFVHRDLKPTNVLVDANGEPTVLDFGVVQLPFGAERWTRPGTVLGTLPFMSPEQVSGLPTGPEVDVFALGLMLYEGILGSRRTPDRPGAWVSLQCLQRIPPALLQDAAVPHALSALLEACCAFYPNDRPTMLDLVGALNDPGLLSRPATPPSCPVFVGRDAEVSGLLERVLSDRPSLTFVEGPPGSGRRRLIEQLHRRASVRGARVFRVVAGREEPGRAAADLLHQLLARPDDPEHQARVLGADAATLRAAFPELPGPPAEGVAARVPEVAELCQAIARALARGAAAQPVVISVEGVELADALTLQLLATLPRHSGGAVHALAVLDEQQVPVEARHFLRRLREAPEVHRIALRDLPQPVFAQLVAHLAPNMAAPTDSGSPQRATEHAWRSLDPACAAPLHAELLPLAVLREPVPGAVIEALGPLPAWERAGLIVAVGVDRYALRHAGLAARAAALLADVQAAEDTVADAIARGWPEPEGRAAEARHRARGRRPAQARPPAIVAAAAALEAGRLPEARRLLHLIDHLARDAKDPVYQQRRFTLAWCRAELSLHGDGPQRADLVEQAARRAQTHEDHARVALLQCRLDLRAGQAQAARRWSALVRSSDTPPAVAARAGHELVHRSLDLGRASELEGLLDATSAASRRAADPISAAMAADARAAVLESQGKLRAADEETQAPLQRAGLPPALRASLLLSRARARTGRGLLDAAEADLRQIKVLLPVIGDAGPLSLAVACGLAELALEQGEANTARRLLISAHARLGARSAPLAIARWTVQSLRLATIGGEREAAAALAARPLPAAGPELGRQGWCAQMELHLCLEGEAPGPPPPAEGPPTPGAARVAALLAEAALRQRAWSQAGRWAEAAHEAAERSESAPLRSLAALLRHTAAGDAASAWRFAAQAASTSRHADLAQAALHLAGWRALRLGQLDEARQQAQQLASWAWRHADHRAAGRARALLAACR